MTKHFWYRKGFHVMQRLYCSTPLLFSKLVKLFQNTYSHFPLQKPRHHEMYVP